VRRQERRVGVAVVLGGAVRRLRGLPPAPDPELERLYTCELGLTSVPAWYGELTGLRTLDLGHNRLTTVPDLSALARLEILYLHDNALTALPTETTSAACRHQ